MTTRTEIAGQPVRYTDAARWMWNNGFRSLWLARGRAEAAAINAARRGDLDAVLAHVSQLGGISQNRSVAASAIKLAGKLAADLPAYKIENGTVFIPTLTWDFHGRSRKQVARIEWLPMWSVH